MGGETARGGQTVALVRGPGETPSVFAGEALETQWQTGTL